MKRACVCGFLGFMMLTNIALISSVSRLEAQSVRKPPVIEASRVVIRDAEGRRRAIFGLSEDGQSGITLYDGEGRLRLNLLVQDSGEGRLEVKDGSDGNAISLATLPDGSAGLSLQTKNGIAMVSSPTGVTGAIVSELNKGPRLVWGIDGRGNPLSELTPPGAAISSPTAPAARP